ncbi:CMP-sialic acid transporter 1-like [Limulus polyphemus]|uniref:CMP-sialic acid transporter 1-like n=1 Tax=Limulus polyphemus TaxID=6850 RepID=A0ABM1B338_LIMPO|nr:CMP-sialic acid transporter 1-like [Limulus polyphemus]
MLDKEDLAVFHGTSLQRKAEGVLANQLLCVFLLIVDVGKSVLSYAVVYHNGGQYPLPQTVIITVIEALKCLTVTLIHLVKTKSLWNLQPSLLFLFPSLVYAVTNNIFFYALTYVTPAVWIVLIQGKVICTLIIYRLCFRKDVTVAQWVAVVLITFAIALSQFRSLTVEGASVPLVAISLSIINSLLAAVVSVYTEVLFKNDNRRSFWEQQIQLYFFGTLLNLMYVVFFDDVKQKAFSFSLVSSNIKTFLVATVVIATLHGITLATIMRQLDNIVKFYISAVGNVMTAIASTLLFPDKFTLDFVFILSLLILIVAIYLYETKNFDIFGNKESELSQNNNSNNNVSK